AGWRHRRAAASGARRPAATGGRAGGARRFRRAPARQAARGRAPAETVILTAQSGIQISAPPPARAFTGPPLLLLFACIALGWNLNGYRLLDPDEGRNAEVAREMALSNDYLVPHLDGLPYLDKPIVYFAAAAGVMELTGVTETAARLPAYIATLATIGLLAWFARRRWGDDAGWLAGVAYATTVLPLAYARTAIFDSTLTLCTTAAILGTLEQQPVAAWAAMAVGALTKGPIAAAIPLLVLVPHALATGASVRRLFPRRGLVAFAVIALPWFVAVSIAHADFPGYVFLRETLARVTTTSFHRTAPFWYYLPIVPVAAFPWIIPGLAPRPDQPHARREGRHSARRARPRRRRAVLGNPGRARRPGPPPPRDDLGVCRRRHRHSILVRESAGRGGRRPVLCRSRERHR